MTNSYSNQMEGRMMVATDHSSDYSSVSKDNNTAITSPFSGALSVSAIDVDVVRSKINESYHCESDSTACDACKICQDVCEKPECNTCRSTPCIDTRQRYVSGSSENKEKRFYTPCQIRRHNHAGSAWLVAGDTVYDATPYLSSSTHPGGSDSILKRAGGAEDCSRDLQFHSVLGKRMFKKFEIGKVRPCGHVDLQNERKEPTKQWWSLIF